MGVKVITIRNRGFCWHHRDGVHAKGYLFDSSETCRRGEAMLDYFAAITEAERFRDRLREANGAFAVILETGQNVFAAVDSVRSIPLFYAMKGRDLVLGDDARAIQRELGGEETDPLAREELLRAGYTVGPNTLDPRIKQIEAGELFVHDKSTTLSSARIYFSHAHGDYTDQSEEMLIEELDHIYSRLTRRLIASVQGRTIVVPLSGGYDSRSLVCSLKREGYSNVICYSYGVPASFERQIAGKVAAQLGYPIHIIDYRRPRWQALLDSQRFAEFIEFAFQCCAAPCVQELLAREELANNKAIPNDAVIVPGYCGDVQGGSFIPTEVRQNHPEKVLNEGINRYILRTHFNLRTSPIPLNAEQAILSRIRTYTSRFRTDDTQDFCSVLEDWLTRNRLSKFIINTLRTHELYGNEWRLPLWDNELIKWWYKVPLRLRVANVFHRRFLFERLFEPMQVGFRKPAPPATLRVFNHMSKSRLLAGAIPVVMALYRISIKPFRPTPVDIDGYNDLSALLLERLPPGWSSSDFVNVHGIVGQCCMQPQSPSP
jgi:asparagine synthase (glutamine-hydrolysing)